MTRRSLPRRSFELDVQLRVKESRAIISGFRVRAKARPE